MRVLEDLGFYCVDNLPVALAPNVAMLAAGRDPALHGVALGVDSRERLFFPQWPRMFAELDAAGIHPEVIFLDASDDVLARRYSESRRPHPMAGHSGATVAESIRARTSRARRDARARRPGDRYRPRSRSTSCARWSPRPCWARARRSRMSISIVSFGYKYGLPVGMDVVLDVRFIPNPFFVPELRSLTGLDPRVHEYVMAQPESRRFIDEVGRLFDFLIPLYQREGKSYLTVGLGCTGGRHRSPVLARELMKRLESGGLRAACATMTSRVSCRRRA